LVVWGLTPHKIHSLVGCSSEIEIFRQPRPNGQTVLSLVPLTITDHGPVPPSSRNVGPCRRCEFAEPTTARKAVETAQVNIKRPFRRYPGRLHDTSGEHICGKLEITVTDEHSVILITARAVLKARRVSPSLDFISEGNEVPVPTGVWTFHPIFRDHRLAFIQLSVSYFKLRNDNPRTDPDVRKSRIKKSCRSV